MLGEIPNTAAALHLLLVKPEVLFLALHQGFSLILQLLVQLRVLQAFLGVSLRQHIELFLQQLQLLPGVQTEVSNQLPGIIIITTTLNCFQPTREPLFELYDHASLSIISLTLFSQSRRIPVSLSGRAVPTHTHSYWT